MKIAQVLIITLIMTLIFSVGFCDQTKVIVTMKKVSLWSEPSFDGEAIDILRKGDELIVKATSGGWIYVKKKIKGSMLYHKGWVAQKWVSKRTNHDSIENVASLDLKQKAIVILEQASFRAAPNFNSRVTAHLWIGEQLLAHRSDGEFLYVTRINAETPMPNGWVAKAAVDLANSVWVNKNPKISETDINKEIGRLKAIVCPIPASNWKKNLEIYKQLLALDPGNQQYKSKVKYYKNYPAIAKARKNIEAKKAKEKEAAHKKKLVAQEKKEAKRAKQKKIETEKAAQGYQLRIINWSWGLSSSGNYATAKGQVKNITDHKLKGIAALVTWSDGNGNMITYDQSMIEYTPLMPGQTSPFSIMERYNPMMKSARIEFKFMHGGRISTYK